MSREPEKQISGPIEANILHISIGGAQIETPCIEVNGLHLSYNNHPTRKNSVFLQWEIPSGRKVKAVGETLWFERVSAAESTYVVGIKFVEISKEDRQALRSFVETTTKIAL